MKRLNRTTVPTTLRRPERIIQFGEGNFLRAFVDWIITEMNDKAGFNSSVVVVQPIPKGMVGTLNEQDGLYTLILKGLINGRPVREQMVLDSISRGIDPFTDYKGYLALAENPEMRFIISNTTEAGIVYSDTDKFKEGVLPETYPGKLTLLLYHRYKTFQGDLKRGFILMPCELIDRNGDNLKKCVLQYTDLWGLEKGFKEWLNTANTFCNTLVDRIVPGYPKQEAETINESAGYEDKLIVEAEPFHLWVIEAPDWVKSEFPTEKAALDVIFTGDMTPYRTRKVRILNGAHTGMVAVGYLYGLDTVRQTVEDPVMGCFVRQMVDEEIVPTLDLPKAELDRFSEQVMDRFKNPFVNHLLTSILLNSISKYKTRNLPSLTMYVERKGTLPDKLVFSLATFIAYYRGESKDRAITLQDDAQVIDFFAQTWKSCGNDYRCVTQKVLANEKMWGQDLNKIEGLTDKTAAYVADIVEKGIKEAVKQVIR